MPGRNAVRDQSQPRPPLQSTRMRQLYERAKRVAGSDVPVLITGETGSGKEVLARWIHACSDRREHPFLAVNCAAIPNELVESTLFGHEKGAFTGAAKQTRGVFEAGAGGVVFLDEIGDLPLPAQAKLLRVLDTGQFARVGSCMERAASVRVLSATHKKLCEMSKHGTFREDLLYRLRVIGLSVPPLRERREEVRSLALSFLHAHAPELRLSDETAEFLEEYHWPGNVRELRNCMAHAAVFARNGVVMTSDLPEEVRCYPGSAAMAPPTPDSPPPPPALEPGSCPPLKTLVAEYEASVLRAALARSGGNRAQAARILQVPLRTFAWKLSRHGTGKLTGFGDGF